MILSLNIVWKTESRFELVRMSLNERD
jgi:hypothetical protein